jgi:Predicted Zn-dependent peptidases
MFKGTTTTEAGEFSRIIKQLGGSVYAFTGSDFTGYYQTVHADFLETCLPYDSDRMVILMLHLVDLRTARGVVPVERRLRTVDYPSSLAYEGIGMLIFGLRLYGIPIIGTLEDFSYIHTPDLEDWYNRYYQPSDATLIIAGDFQEFKTHPLIEKYFGPLQNKNTTSESKKISHQNSYKDIVLKDNVSSPLLVMSFGNNAYDMNNPSDSYALAVLFELMDGGFSSRFTKTLTNTPIALPSFIYFEKRAKEENLISIRWNALVQNKINF